MNYLLFNSKSAASEGMKEVLQASAKLSEKYGEFALKDLIELNKEAFSPLSIPAISSLSPEGMAPSTISSTKSGPLRFLRSSSFSRPTGFQIDGEIVPKATSYKVYFPEE